MRSLFALVVLVVSLVSCGVAFAAETHPFSVHDMLAMQRVSDPVVSPDGGLVAFGLRTTDLEENRGRSDIYLVGADGTGLRRMTSHPAADWNARFSADGSQLYFLSTRSGSAQVWRIALGGGEAEQVTELPLDVGSLRVSPDGKMLAFSMAVFPECHSLACTTAKLKAEDERVATGRLFTKLFIRHWDTWKDGRRSHLFVLDLASGRTVDVTQGLDADVPTKPWGGPEEFTFTPDSKGLVFTARDAGPEEAWSTNFDLFLVPADGSAKPALLTGDNKAWDTTPVFSPDGKTLAWLAMAKPGYEADRFRIMLRRWPEGETRVLTESWDRSPSSIVFSSDGRTIFTHASNLGHRSIFRIDVGSSRVREIHHDGNAGTPQVAGERLVFGLDHLNSPVELYSMAQDGSDRKAITSINAERLAAARMGEAEQFTFKGWNGETVYAWVLKPADYVAGKKYPVAFLIHGGPQGSFGNHFHYRWNPQAYAGAGYASVFIDFHGSTGYGQEFTDSIGNDWGGKPLVDLQKGLAAALEKYPFLDGKRVGALGASYGGYMINWIAGNWPDRFRCLVNHDGNLDERLAYFDTEELWFPEWEHRGTPWDNPEGYEKHNPINFVSKWKTPMLVIHGAKDYRVVETQGMSTFTALQRRGIPSKFLYFPDENHWVLQPANSILWHDTVMAWLGEWL